MKILVTGAAGFLGRHLAAEAASRGQVIAVVRVSCDISGAIVVERANLSGRDAVRLLFERWRPNVVLHAPHGLCGRRARTFTHFSTTTFAQPSTSTTIRRWLARDGWYSARPCLCDDDRKPFPSAKIILLIRALHRR